MDIKCCDCSVVVGTVYMSCHIKKNKIRCDKCYELFHIADRWREAVDNCGSNDLSTMTKLEFINKNNATVKSELLDFSNEDINDSTFLQLIRTSNLSTIKIINISSDTDSRSCDDFITALSQNKTLLSLEEICIRGRKFSTDVLCAFRDNLRFDGPLIREDDYMYGDVIVAPITIVHNDKSLDLLDAYDRNNKLNHVSNHPNKIVYGFSKCKYYGNLARIRLEFSYND